MEGGMISKIKEKKKQLSNLTMKQIMNIKKVSNEAQTIEGIKVFYLHEFEPVYKLSFTYIILLFKHSFFLNTGQRRLQSRKGELPQLCVLAHSKILPC